MNYPGHNPYNFADSIDKIFSGKTLRYETTYCEDRWVSNIMMDVIKTSTGEFSNDPIFICSQTGSGKSTFVLEQLAEYAKKENKNVLLLCNRSALNMQQKMNYSSKAELPQMGSSVLADVLIFENVFIVTYQSVLSFLNQQYKENNGIYSAQWYVVFDEAHFFNSDSNFNAQTAHILHAVVSTMYLSKRIYMTATPKEVKPLIAHVEYQLAENMEQSRHPILMPRAAKKIREYVFPENYDYLDIVFFKSREELVSKIVANETDKWLVFVSSKDAGRELAGLLNDSKVNYMDATTKREDSGEFFRLARKNKFSGRVLIATSVLDNGFNIKDDKVKNIAVDSYSEVQMKQMLGRKRVNDGERVTLYVHSMTGETLNQLRNAFRRQYNELSEYASDPSGYFRKEWGDFPPEVQHLLEPYFLPDGMAFVPNPFGAYQIGIALGNCERLLDAIDEDKEFGFEKTVLSWFKKEASEVVYTDDHKQSLDLQLRELYTDALKKQPLTVEGAKALSEAMSEVVRKLKKSGTVVPNHRPSETETRYIKNITAVLSYLGENCELKKRNKMFRFVETADPPADKSEQQKAHRDDLD